MRAIFISYRRDDTEGHAGRLFEALIDRFGKDAVFMDVAGIEPGRDFRRAIEQQVASCGVLLALIGKNWLKITDQDGKRRLDDPYDFVRLETASALKRDIPVIPVLVHDAGMPNAEQLPDDLKELAFRNNVELTHARWASDVQLLINALLPHVDVTPPAPMPPPTPPPQPTATGRHPPWVTAPLAVLALGGVGYLAWDHFAPSPSPAPAAAPGGAASAPIGVVAAASMAAAPAPVAAAPVSAPPSPVAAPATSAPAPAPAPAPASAAAAAPLAAKPLPVEKRPPAPSPAPAPKPIIAAPRPAPAPVAAAAPAPAPEPAPAPVSRPSPSPSPSPAAANEVLATRDPGTDLFGSPATVAMVTRTIVIKPDANWVNVTGGEVIRFETGGKSFVWAFNGTRSSFDLGLIAPAGLLGRKVTAYVAPNPLQPKRS